MSVFFGTRRATGGRPHRLTEADAELLHHLDALLLIFRAGHPEVLLVLHDVGEHRSAHEDHVLSTRWILDTDFEFLRKYDTVLI